MLMLLPRVVRRPSIPPAQSSLVAQEAKTAYLVKNIYKMHLYEDYADFTACDLTFKTATNDNYNLYYNGIINKSIN